MKSRTAGLSVEGAEESCGEAAVSMRRALQSSQCERQVAEASWQAQAVQLEAISHAELRRWEQQTWTPLSKAELVMLLASAAFYRSDGAANSQAAQAFHSTRLKITSQ